MARPTNSIANIKLPGESTQRPIVPYALGVSASNPYQAVLPTLTEDATLVTGGTLATLDWEVYGTWCFCNEPIRINSDNYSTYTEDDWDTYIYADKIQIENANTSKTWNLLFPELADGEEAILGLQIHIDDWRS